MPLSKAALDSVQGCLEMCALEKEVPSVCLSVCAGTTPCCAPQREEEEERGQLRKRADVRRNKPVIAPGTVHIQLKAPPCQTPIRTLGCQQPLWIQHI